MQARVFAVQHAYLGVLYGFYHFLRYEFNVVADACQMFEGVEQQCGTGSEQFAGFGCDDGAVGELYGCGGHSFLVAALFGGHGGATEIGGDVGLFHQQGDFVYLAFAGFAAGVVAQGCVVASYYLVFGGLAAHFVVGDAETGHVHTHVGGRFVGVFAVDAFEQGVEHGENLDVAVVVYCCFAVGFQMEGVYHVDVVEVGGGCLVGDVDGVFQRYAPDWECLEFGISGFNAAAVFLIQLAETGGHFAAAGAGGCDDYQRTSGLDVVVFAEAFVGGDEFYIGGIAFDKVVVVNFNT